MDPCYHLPYSIKRKEKRERECEGRERERGRRAFKGTQRDTSHTFLLIPAFGDGAALKKESSLPCVDPCLLFSNFLTPFLIRSSLINE